MPTVYDKYGQSEFGGALSPCYKHVANLLSEAKVLDIASGDGTYLRHFGKKSMGIDISDPNIEICTKMGLKVFKADLNTIFPIKNNSFDAVFCSNILEHVDSPIFMLRESHRVLKKDGYLILCVPNEDSFIYYWYDYFEKNGRHLYSYSINNLEALTRETGFQILKMFGDFHSVKTRELRLTKLLECLHFIPMRFVLKFTNFFWVVAIKK